MPWSMFGHPLGNHTVLQKLIIFLPPEILYIYIYIYMINRRTIYLLHTARLNSVSISILHKDLYVFGRSETMQDTSMHSSAVALAIYLLHRKHKQPINPSA